MKDNGIFSCLTSLSFNFSTLFPLVDGMSSSIPDYQGKTALTLAFEMGYEDDVLEAMAISSDDDGGLLTLSIDALTEKYCRKVDDNINSSPPKRVEDDRSSSSVEVPAPSHSQAMATAFAQGLLHQLPQLPQIVLPQLPQFPQMPHFPQLPPFPQLPQFPQFPQIPQMMWNPQAMALYFMSPIAQYGTGNVVVGIPAASSSTTNTPSGTSASTLTSSSHPKLSVDSQSTPTSVHSPASPTSDTSSSSSSSASQPLRQRQQSINKNNGALIQLQQQLQQPPPPRPRWQDANTILDVIILIFNTVRPSRSWSRVCYCGSCAMCRRKEVSSQSSATSSRTGTTITLNQPKSDPYYFSIWFPIVSGLILLGLLHYVLDYYVFEYILRFVNAVDLRSFFATARAGDVAGAGGAAAAIGAPLLFG